MPLLSALLRKAVELDAVSNAARVAMAELTVRILNSIAILAGRCTLLKVNAALHRQRKAIKGS